MIDPTDFTRTAAAIEAYDAYDAQTQALLSKAETNEDVHTIFAKLEQLGERVGEAFGLDTADRNNLDTCRRLVRPGPKIPGPGYGENFVRKAVREFKEQQAAKRG